LTARNLLKAVCLTVISWSACFFNIGVNAEEADKGLAYGKLLVEPIFSAELTYDDNVFRQQTSPTSALLSTLNSQLKLSVNNEMNRSSVGYQGSYVDVQQSPADNYMDHMVFGRLQHALLRNLSFVFSGAYQLAHEKRGETYIVDTVSNFDVPDAFVLKQIKANMVLGSEQSQGRLQLEGEKRTKLFTTRLDVTGRRSHELQVANLVLTRRISPKTAFLLKGGYSQYDYTNEDSLLASRDSADLTVGLGAQWEFTRLTKGEFVFGLHNKNFTDASKPQVTGKEWLLAMTWSPLEDLEFELTSGGTLEESTTTGNYTDSKRVSIGAQYSFFDKLLLKPQAWVNSAEYPPELGRDIALGGEFAAVVNTAKWVQIGAALRYLRQYSFRDGFSYREKMLIGRILIRP